MLENMLVRLLVGIAILFIGIIEFWDSVFMLRVFFVLLLLMAALFTMAEKKEIADDIIVEVKDSEG